MTTEIDFEKLTTFIRNYCDAYSLPDQSADVLEFVRVDMLLRPNQYALHRLSTMHVTAARRIRQLAGECTDTSAAASATTRRLA